MNIRFGFCCLFFFFFFTGVLCDKRQNHGYSPSVLCGSSYWLDILCSTRYICLVFFYHFFLFFSFFFPFSGRKNAHLGMSGDIFFPFLLSPYFVLSFSIFFSSVL